MASTLNAYVMATHCLPACLPSYLLTYQATDWTKRPTDLSTYLVF